MNDDICEMAGLSFDRIRRVTDRRLVNLELGLNGGYLQATKLNDTTLEPEADIILPMAPQSLEISIEWPLPGMAFWTKQPTLEDPWKVELDELFDPQSKKKLDCDGWLGQIQLVMFDNRGVSLQEVIKITADTEGAHSSEVSRLSQVEGERRRAVKNPELHILSNITICGMKYNHIVVIESALYLYSKLHENKSTERPEGGVYIPTFCSVPEDVFSSHRNWIAFDGGFLISFGGREQTISHRIRATR